MATLVLGAAGAALGSVFGGVGAVVGRAAGALAGHALDQMLFGGGRRSEGPRLSDLQVQGSTEGAAIPRLYGRARLAGQVIWATDFEEEERTEASGGKGGASAEATTYRYFANFAVALCEGPIARVGRIWADGKPLDQDRFTIRVHRGTEGQDADSLIVARQSEAPAYRGTAYAVFEHMPLADFGNRIPQLTFEVIKPVGGMEEHVRAVCIIPGSTEFGYDPEPVRRVVGEGSSATENAHAARRTSDWTVSLDELQALCPNLEWATLVVAWFGDDLRAGHCTVRPKVDDTAKATSGATWRVGDLVRADAERVSLVDGRPAYGGTPSDASVLRAVADLKARGLKVLLAPFVMMDIPPGNDLPDPESGEDGQPPFPWRGTITCNPAPGRPGSPDKSAAAADQVEEFLGTADAGDFHASGEAVSYSGPAEWRYRRMILHYARLAALAGDVDAFLVGSELRGLTTVRSSVGHYPFVVALKALAEDVRGIVGADTKISYAADWSEYFGHQPADGSGDVRFHLDPLWAADDVDFVGIDIYHPLSDWRDEAGHRDEASGRSPYDLAYLGGNLRGGEGYDWFYPSRAHRDAQTRTAITDGAAGKPWVFRFKDLEAWWSNRHFDRPGGVESDDHTDWVPQSKPIWFTELGCPAVDKGANQPNVFFDPKSSASALPYYSSGARDDLQQRRYIEAFQAGFDPEHPDFTGGNPISDLYGGRMVAPHMHLWAWDARPYPFFPALTDVWSDGGNWRLGHWLNGRLGSATLQGVIEAVLRDHGFDDYEIRDVDGVLDGYLVDDVLSARGTLEPLLQVFRIDASDGGDRILIRGRERPADIAVEAGTLIDTAGEPSLTRTRTQETELPSELVLRATAPDSDYRIAASASRRLAGESRRTRTIDIPAVLDFEQAESLTETLLRDIWTGREEAEFALPPSLGAIEPGDIITLPEGTRVSADRIEDGLGRKIHARQAMTGRAAAASRTPRPARPAATPHFGPPTVRIIDYAPPAGVEPQAPRIAVFAEPWPGTIAVYAAAVGGGFRLLDTVTRRATMGRLTTPLGAGPVGVFDSGNAVEVALFGGTLASLPDIDVLGGGNAAAVRCADGSWEILQFATAELIGQKLYRLTRLLRGQCGSEQAMAGGAASGADFVLLDQAVTTMPLTSSATGVPLRLRVGPARDDNAAPSFAEITVTPSGVGLRPFAPVHARAARDAASGDVQLGWTRRTRFGGDSWALADAPLNEAVEAYRIEVLDGATPKRQATTVAPAWIYAAADQAEDFGGAAGDFTLRVAQLSATAGPGYTLTETIHV